MEPRDILTLQELSDKELRLIFNEARRFKYIHKLGGVVEPFLKDRFVGLLFEKPSTRTRLSLEVAVRSLGGYGVYLSFHETQLSRGEGIADTARVLSRYVDAIIARVHRHKDLEDMAYYADVPVINALSDLHHPLQALADFFTIWEKKGDLRMLKVVFIGDGACNVAHSNLIIASKLGVSFTICCPRGYEPNTQILNMAFDNAKLSGSKIQVAINPEEAVEGADVVMTDVWVSMGFEDEREKRMKALSPYQVNSSLTSHADKEYIFLHCLPCRRGEEVTSQVVDDLNHSVVWDQAENRLHTSKALLALILGSLKRYL